MNPAHWKPVRRTKVFAEKCLTVVWCPLRFKRGFDHKARKIQFHAVSSALLHYHLGIRMKAGSVTKCSDRINGRQIRSLRCVPGFHPQN